MGDNVFVIISYVHVRLTHMTYRTKYQADTNGNIESPHNSRRPVQQISISWNKELLINTIQRTQ